VIERLCVRPGLARNLGGAQQGHRSAWVRSHLRPAQTSAQQRQAMAAPPAPRPSMSAAQRQSVAAKRPGAGSLRGWIEFGQQRPVLAAEAASAAAL